MASHHKIGVLVAIPIKGRKLINRTGGKQSPYVQLKLGAEQKKRTRASLIASVRLDVYQGQMDMHVAVYDEGKKNELIGDGILLLHEVVDKGELDVWFPIKYNGTPAGDIYFELTYYAAAPPPAAGGTPPIPQAQVQTPIRHTQLTYQGGPGMHAVPHGPPATGFGSPTVGPPAPYPGNMYHSTYNAAPRPFTAPYSGSPAATPGFQPQPFGGALPFRPPGAGPYPNNTSPQFSSSNIPGGAYPNHMPQMPQPFNGGHAGNTGNNMNNNNNNNTPRFPVPQHSSPAGQHMNVTPGFPQGPGGGPPNSYPNNTPNSYPNSGPNNNNNNNNHNFSHAGPPNSYPNNNNSSGPNNGFNSFNNGPNSNFNSHTNVHINSNPSHNNNFNNNQNGNFNNHNSNHNNNNNNNNNTNNLAAGGNSGMPVTPLMQYNYSLESFP
ncbi:hypothetical protein EDD11_005299 [Mortierella claussenii]|nr:hypothetical protein EDD11_005299 [Mortierella claussenii]